MNLKMRKLEVGEVDPFPVCKKGYWKWKCIKKNEFLCNETRKQALGAEHNSSCSGCSYSPALIRWGLALPRAGVQLRAVPLTGTRCCAALVLEGFSGTPHSEIFHPPWPRRGRRAEATHMQLMKTSAWMPTTLCFPQRPSWRVRCISAPHWGACLVYQVFSHSLFLFSNLCCFLDNCSVSHILSSFWQLISNHQKSMKPGSRPRFSDANNFPPHLVTVYTFCNTKHH